MPSAAGLACLGEHSQQSPVGPAAQGAWPSLGTMIHAQGTSWWQQSQDSYLGLWTTTSHTHNHGPVVVWPGICVPLSCAVITQVTS